MTLTRYVLDITLSQLIERLGKLSSISAVTSFGASLLAQTSADSLRSLLGVTQNVEGSLAEVYTLTADEVFSAGQIGYIKSNGNTALADASFVDSAKGLLVRALGSVSAGDSGSFIELRGNWNTVGLSQGVVYYLSETPGGITADAPTTQGAVVRELGTAVSATLINFTGNSTYTIVPTSSGGGVANAPPIIESSGSGFGATGSVVVAAPQDIENGDVLILIATTDYSSGTTSDYTPPSGFSEILSYQRVNPAGAGIAMQAWAKVASGESGDYTLLEDGLRETAAVMLRVSGADLDTPIIISGSDIGTAEPVTASALTVPVNYTNIVTVYAWDASKTLVADPAGNSLVEHVDQTGIDLVVYRKNLLESGDSGAATVDISSGAPWVAFSMALQPPNATAGESAGGSGLGPFDLSDRKLTLPVNAAGQLSGNTDAYEIFPSTSAEYNAGNPDLLTYSHPLYFKRTADYYDLGSPLNGAYTSSNTNGPARSEWRYLRNYTISATMRQKFKFSVQSMPNNAKANIGQIHRLDAPPVFKLSYLSKADGSGTYRALVKKTASSSDEVTTLLTGITNGDVIEVEWEWSMTTEILKFWIDADIGNEGSPTATITGVQADGFRSYKKLGIYPNSAGDGNATDIQVVRILSDEEIS